MTAVTAAARRLYDVLAGPLEGQALYDAIEAAHHQLGAALEGEAGMGNVHRLEGRALPARPAKTKGAAKLPKRWEVSPHATVLRCEACGVERSALAFPRKGDGRGQPCRVCRPQGTRLIAPDMGGAA